MKLFLVICVIIIFGAITYFENSMRKMKDKLERIEDNGRSNNK